MCVDDARARRRRAVFCASAAGSFLRQCDGLSAAAAAVAIDLLLELTDGLIGNFTRLLLCHFWVIGTAASRLVLRGKIH